MFAETTAAAPSTSPTSSALSCFDSVFSFPSPLVSGTIMGSTSVAVIGACALSGVLGELAPKDTSPLSGSPFCGWDK